jgi:Flp pilus assembly protein TadG
MVIPLAFALLFAVVEYAYYLGAVHYVNYATFAAARALQGNDDGAAAAGMLLTGNATRDANVQVNDSFVSSTLEWEASTPGFEQVMGDMTVTTTVVLGPPECRYELTSSSSASAYSDNRLKGGGC